MNIQEIKETPQCEYQNECEYHAPYTDCREYYDCCDCGNGQCGCRGCFSCNACDDCLNSEED